MLARTMQSSFHIAMYLTSLSGVLTLVFDTEVITDSGKDGTKNSSSTADPITGQTFQSPEHQLILYRRLFKQNHAIQLEAVKGLQSHQDYAKQYQLVNLMLEQIFKVNGQAQINLTLSGYRPGDAFPSNETIRHAMSKVLENTAMFGELALRLPDIVHRIYDKNRDWHILMSWSVWFTNESGILDDAQNRLLHLMSQEINLTEKDANYVNPFTTDYQIKQKQLKANIPTMEPAKKKKKAKTIRKGPRITSRSHGDL